MRNERGYENQSDADPFSYDTPGPGQSSADKESQYVIFGGKRVDVIEGGKLDDHLYGGLGTDYLAGKSGNDYLEGGDGITISNGITGAGTNFQFAGQPNLSLKQLLDTTKTKVTFNSATDSISSSGPSSLYAGGGEINQYRIGVFAAVPWNIKPTGNGTGSVIANCESNANNEQKWRYAA